MRVDDSSGARRPAPRFRQRDVAAHVHAALPAALHPTLRRVLAARAVSPAELAPALRQLVPIGSLPGVGAAAERLKLARERGERVLVVGDFDADGATAAALLLTVLREFGFATPGFLVPNRFAFGYGLSPEVVDLAAQSKPHLIVTVDTGVTSIAGVDRARALGIEVIVTDHHLAGPALPVGALIVSSNLPGAPFGSPALCGVGVAFYVAAEVGRVLAAAGAIDSQRANEIVAACLDLVAVGTVADLVSLDFNNRILVREGLRRIRHGRSRPGLEALFAVAGRDPRDATAADLGFAIAPRLNAAGRLADMTLGVDCLLESDPVRAAALAARLEALNVERRELQARMQQEAGQLLATVSPTGDSGESCCLVDPRWHAGVVGLVANRIRELTGRPAIAFAPAGEPGWLRGSARSAAGVHVRDAIAAALVSLPDTAARFGGHAMAAGISLPAAELPAFRRSFAAVLARQSQDVETRVWTDGPLAPDELGLELAELLRDAGPWGQGFPEPFFDNELSIVSQRIVGERHLKLRLRHPKVGDTLDAIAFNAGPISVPPSGLARFVYRLDVNVFRDRRSAQLVVEHVVTDYDDGLSRGP